MTKREIRKSYGKRCKIDWPESFYHGMKGIIDIKSRGRQDDDEFDYGFNGDEFEGVCYQIPAEKYILI